MARSEQVQSACAARAGAGRNSSSQPMSPFGNTYAAQASTRHRSSSNKGASRALPGSYAKGTRGGAREQGQHVRRREEDLQCMQEAPIAATSDNGGARPEDDEDTSILHPPSERPSTSEELSAAQTAPQKTLESEIDAKSRAHERKLQEQNQRFWETANKMDKALIAEENRCATLMRELSEVEESRVESSERQSQAEHRLCESEASLNSMHSEVEKLRKATRERVTRHAADMETLSEQLCKAQVRFTEAEDVVVRVQAELLEAQRGLSNEIAMRARDFDKVQSVSELEKKLSLEAEENLKLRERATLHEACTSEMSGQRLALEESRNNVEHALDLHTKELSAVREELRETHKLEVSEAVALCREAGEVAALRDECFGLADLRRDAAETNVARSLEQTHLDEAAHFRNMAILSEQTVEAVRAEVASRGVQLQKAEETSRRMELEIRMEADIAARATEEVQLTKAQAFDADEKAANSSRRLLALEHELRDMQHREEEQRSFWVASHRSSVRAEEQEVASESKLARERLTDEQWRCRRAIQAANVAASEASEQQQSEAAQLRCMAAELVQKDEALLAADEESTLAQNRLRDLELESASQITNSLALREQLEENILEDRACFNAELRASEAARNLLQDEEERQAAATNNEAEERLSLQRQLANSREKTAKLQELADALRGDGDEMSAELAQARATAKRHGQAATEFRAELVAAKRDLAKSQHAERDLKQAVSEVETLSAKLSRAQRGREVAEHEVKQGHSRQAGLERQVRELQTRFAADRMSWQDREPSFHRDGSADVYCFNNVQAAGLDTGRATSPLLTPGMGSQSLRRNRSADLRPEFGIAAASPALAQEPDPNVASPGMGRSRSFSVSAMGSAQDNDAVECIDPRNQAQGSYTVAADSPMGVLRTSQHHSSSQPPRPPQMFAPRMGWATHARNRTETNCDRQSDALYSPGTSGSSIDRVIR